MLSMAGLALLYFWLPWSPILAEGSLDELVANEALFLPVSICTVTFPTILNTFEMRVRAVQWSAKSAPNCFWLSHMKAL